MRKALNSAGLSSSPGTEFDTPGLDCPYGTYIFTLSLFFINPDICVENRVCIFLYPFCATFTQRL